MDCIDEAPNRTSGSFERQSLRDSERPAADESEANLLATTTSGQPSIALSTTGRYAYTIGFYRRSTVIGTANS